MAKITLNIEASNTEELQGILKELQGSSDLVKTVEKSNQKPVEKPTEKVDEKPQVAEKKKPTPKPKKEEVSTDSTSKKKDSTPEKKEPPVDETEPTTSATANKYPNASMSDVVAKVKQALENQKRDEVRTALERQGVSKVPELDPANLGVFLTDLEVLVGD